jgi:hypothetical protein
MLLYTRNLILKIAARILRKHCQITFLRTFRSRRPPTPVIGGTMVIRSSMGGGGGASMEVNRDIEKEDMDMEIEAME